MSTRPLAHDEDDDDFLGGIDELPSYLDAAAGGGEHFVEDEDDDVPFLMEGDAEIGLDELIESFNMCSVCGITFSTPVMLEEHKASHVEVTCDRCGELVVDQAGHDRQHVCFESPPTHAIVCQVHQICITTKKALERHNRICVDRSTHSSSAEALWTDVPQMSEKKCTVCGAHVVNPQRHWHMHTLYWDEKNGIKCHEHMVVLEGKNSIKNHLLLPHTVATKEYLQSLYIKCGGEKEIFEIGSTTFEAAQHIKCTRCHMSLLDRQHAQRHAKQHAVFDQQRTGVCVCPSHQLAFETKSEAMGHLNSHSNDKAAKDMIVEQAKGLGWMSDRFCPVEKCRLDFGKAPETYKKKHADAHKRFYDNACTPKEVPCVDYEMCVMSYGVGANVHRTLSHTTPCKVMLSKSR